MGNLFRRQGQEEEKERQRQEEEIERQRQKKEKKEKRQLQRQNEEIERQRQKKEKKEIKRQLQRQNEEIERQRQEEEQRQEKERQEKERKQKRIERKIVVLERKLEQESSPQRQEKLKHELKELKREQHEIIERQVRVLEENWKLQRPQRPQRQQPEKISELNEEQHDQLLLFSLSTEGRTLEKLVCERLPIVDIVDSMGSFVSQKYKTDIKNIEEKNGPFAASKRFLLLATVRKLKIGWSRQLLQTITTLDLKYVEELIRPKQADLEDFHKRIGIPCKSLLDQLTDALRTHCGILVSPMGKKDNKSEVVPVVHPKLCISVNHFRMNTAFSNGTYKPSEVRRQAYKDAPRISFNDVTKSNVQTLVSPNQFSSVMRTHHGLFLFLIGAAGSGKTTITKRMVKTWLEENKMAFLIPFAQIPKDERQSLKNLLTKFLCRLHNLKHDPSEEEIDEAFNWVLVNQDKCLLIFDGLDQSSFDISKEPIEDPDINGEFLPGDLMSLLMSRKFLPGCRLILSSRTHSLVQLDTAIQIQPNIVVFLNDLLSDDVEKLMDHYLEQGTAGEIMEKLRVKSPRIHQLIYNPLFLRLVAMLNNEVGEGVWTYVNTTAKLFFEVIERLQSSAHHECGSGVDGVEDLNLKLAEMAFDKTKQGSVVFEEKDLERYGLIDENVQDFLFGVPASKKNTALLVGLVVAFYFNHQSTQEFFSARFAVEKLAVGEFKEFVGNLFPRLEKDEDGNLEVGEDSFAMLRVLVIGCVNEIALEIILVKKECFINFLCDHLRQLFVKDSSGGYAVKEHQKQMLADLLDFREEEIVRKIREHLEDFNFSFQFNGDSALNVAAHREGFYHFMHHFVSNVQQLELDIEEWNDDEIRKLFQEIQHSSSKIEELEITIKPQLEHVSDVVATFPLLTRKLTLTLVLRGDDDDDDDRRFCRKLMNEIINFDTSKLQTQELKVEVRDGSRRTTFVLLKVVLRRGEPPQFTKLDISEWNDDEIRKLFQTIQQSSSEIEEMLIKMKPQLEHASDVVATFPLLTRKLQLVLRGGDDDRRRFCRELKEEIINFDTSKLQTQELKVEVRHSPGRYSTATTILLEVVLRRGQSLQFTKDVFNF